VMNGISATTGIDEHGNAVPTMANAEAGVRNEHDILTGSQPDGRAYPASGPNYDCAGWTSNQAAPPAVPADAASEGGALVDTGLLDGALADAAPPGPVARVGHVNRMGTAPPPNNNASWNSVHTTPGCAQADIRRVGGAGRTYCFALGSTQSD
jgi:hypothetical protein